MKIRYNSPVILTFSIVVVLVQLVDTYLIPEFTKTIFLVGGTISFIDPLDYFRLFSHVLGHTDWEHLLCVVIEQVCVPLYRPHEGKGQWPVVSSLRQEPWKEKKERGILSPHIPRFVLSSVNEIPSYSSAHSWSGLFRYRIL